jgi:hypothetical protein
MAAAGRNNNTRQDETVCLLIVTTIDERLCSGSFVRRRAVETVRTIIDGCRRPQQTRRDRLLRVAALEHRRWYYINSCVGAFLVKEEATMVAYRLPVIVEVLDEGERAFNGIGSHCRVVEDPCGWTFRRLADGLTLLTPELRKITHVLLKVCRCVTEDDFGSFGSMPVTQGND